MVVLLKSYDVVGEKKNLQCGGECLNLLPLSEKELIHNSRLHCFSLAAPGIVCIKSRWKKPVSVGFAWEMVQKSFL